MPLSSSRDTSVSISPAAAGSEHTKSRETAGHRGTSRLWTVFLSAQEWGGVQKRHPSPRLVQRLYWGVLGSELFVGVESL